MRTFIRSTVVLLALLGWVTFLSGGPNAPPRAQSEFAIMGTAKILCSAVFVSGRDLEEALGNSGGMFLSDEDWELLRTRAAGEPSAHPPLGVGPQRPIQGKSDAKIELDRTATEVRITLHGYTSRARYFGDQGCTIIPPGYDNVFYQPVKLQTKLPDPATQDWPMGDRIPSAPAASGVDEAKVKEAVDAAFAGDGLTAAFVVLHKGRIIAERYGQGAGKDTQLESWSMGKSVTATLVGILIREGKLGLHDLAPVPLWRQNPEDPRSRIRVSDLLRMSGGLRFTHDSQPDWQWGRPVADHFFIYMGAVDAFHFSITRPPEFPPNTEGRYRNCDPLTLGYIVRQTVEKEGENYLAWPQKALFDRIGIRKQVLEPDPYGNFLLTGYDYGTGRNWARLGQLYLQDGVWNGERILPEGYAKFVSTRAPGWKEPVYGGLFWVNGNRRWRAPESAFFMAGAGGQNVVIIPTHDLVVARLGHGRGARAGSQALNNAIEKLVEAVGPRRVTRAEGAP